MLNTALNPAALAAEFRNRERLVINDILTPEAADSLLEALKSRTSWSAAFRSKGAPVMIPLEEMAKLPHNLRAEMRDDLQTASTGAFQYLYYVYKAAEAARAGRDAGHPAHRWFEAINAPEGLAFFRQVTGDPGLAFADCQATLFAPGHFLTQHSDRVAQEHRRVAYVLNLAKDWRADFGGVLNFFDAQGGIEEAFVPGFNTLSLFALPQEHAVTFVPPFAPQGRFALSGWFQGAGAPEAGSRYAQPE